MDISDLSTQYDLFISATSVSFYLAAGLGLLMIPIAFLVTLSKSKNRDKLVYGTLALFVVSIVALMSVSLYNGNRSDSNKEELRASLIERVEEAYAVEDSLEPNEAHALMFEGKVVERFFTRDGEHSKVTLTNSGGKLIVLNEDDQKIYPTLAELEEAGKK